MKTKLTARLLDFLSDRGYQYLLLQFKETTANRQSERFVFIPVKNFENISHYYFGSSSCFYLEAEPRLMAEGVQGKAFFVYLSEDEMIEFSHYLETVTWKKRAGLNTIN